MHVCTCESECMRKTHVQMFTEGRRGHQILWNPKLLGDATWVLETKFRSSQEQSVLLTTEPSLQAQQPLI